MPQNAYDIFIKSSKNLYYIDKHDQNIDATSCEWWCIAFLYYMSNTKGPMLDKMKKFDKKFNRKKTIENEIDFKKYIDEIHFK
jgi:hypothetical protein